MRELLRARKEANKQTRLWMGAAAKCLGKWKAPPHSNPLADDTDASGADNPLTDDAEASSNGKGPTGEDKIVVLSDDEDYA